MPAAAGILISESDFIGVLDYVMQLEKTNGCRRNILTLYKFRGGVYSADSPTETSHVHV